MKWFKRFWLSFSVFRDALLFMSLVFICLIGGCIKDDMLTVSPVMEFNTSQGFTYMDTSLRLGESIQVGLIADANGGENITMLEYQIKGGDYSAAVDSGMNTPRMICTKKIVKGIYPEETWTFTVKNKAGIKKSLSLKITLDTSSKYGPINHLPSITLGAQENSSTGPAYSFTNNQNYLIAQAATNASLIDLLYYYDTLTSEENVISSPGGNIDNSIYGAQVGPSSWSVKNTTRFEQVVIDSQTFDKSKNDSLIFANSFEYASGKRKCKNLKAGDIYAFGLNNGKKGLLKVLSVEGKEEGTIQIEIKMQK